MKKLTVEEETKTRSLLWQEIKSSAEARYISRVHAVLLACAGLSSYEIAGMLGHSARSVEEWIKRYNKNSLDGLREERRKGRPGAISTECFELLVSDIEQDPSEFGYDEWNCRNLSAHLMRRYGIKLSERQCRRVLERLKERTTGEVLHET
ncbi:MAG: helix-turn-helix domain-containing protein [Thermoplasmata archaeon]|uniref:Helix-turn-helix domain-containing protein n=1 Tax=Candidatus Sysuiplasma superficiale TaxID=2823368 RepID=A0A8J7YK94_9ARCH|nr:helix-turn-helix domain-containing protein [Candidatus Sysuiplasma superficiale]MBX8644539.1 helix-turn-helix domain-containing protein [Candidatus Sysuiplasma superficiale]MCL4347195.1 helix-turn-helix domain-containing protein [Candidatus Thermoplasmatota archaeon]MCL5437253.1 helix-turn-helix domain-containing protein [Candidatus Thermoplasmatota archaeon]